MLGTAEFKSLSVNGSKSLFGYRIDPGVITSQSGFFFFFFEQAACPSLYKEYRNMRNQSVTTITHQEEAGKKELDSDSRERGNNCSVA